MLTNQQQWLRHLQCEYEIWKIQKKAFEKYNQANPKEELLMPFNCCVLPRAIQSRTYIARLLVFFDYYKYINL